KGNYVALPYNATAAEIQAGLETLPSIGTGNVTVTAGATAGTFDIVSSNANTLPSLTPADSAATNPAAPATIAGGMLKVTGTKGVYILTDQNDYAALPAGATADQIKAALARFAALPYNATADQIKTALGKFASVGGANNVTVTDTAGTFTITFQGT